MLLLVGSSDEVASDDDCSELVLVGASEIEVKPLLVLSPEDVGSMVLLLVDPSVEVDSDEVWSKLVLVGPSELEVSPLLVLSSDDVGSKVLLAVGPSEDVSEDVGPELVSLVLLVN